MAYSVRELADTGFVSVQNFVKLGLYLKKWYDKQQASWEVQILKFRNWICLRKLHRSGLDLLPFFQVLPSSAMVFTLIFRNSCSQNLRSFANILPKLDFTKFWRNTKCLCAETLRCFCFLVTCYFMLIPSMIISCTKNLYRRVSLNPQPTDHHSPPQTADPAQATTCACS